MRVALFGARDQRPFEVIERSKQRDRAMAAVIMGLCSWMARHQRQTRLGTLESLALAFLVTAQHQSFRRRVQIQADDIPELLLEPGVIRQFEGPDDVRLQIVSGPYALHGTG